MKTKLRPVLDGDFWMIGDNPDLGGLDGRSAGRVQECVDHHVFFAEDGNWHLWGCIRGTAVGRVLYHWRAPHLTDRHWEQTGEMLRCDPAFGENLSHWEGEEWIQSPFIIKENGSYFLFYGGHSTEWDYDGQARGHSDPRVRSAASRCQICLMTSPDGIHWRRHRDERGYSRLFAGPGESRDPALLKIGEVWYLYCAGGVVTPEGEALPQIYVRTSRDLYHWSDWQVALYDDTPPKEGVRSIWSHECPLVVEREGYFYLFRTESYDQRITHVYRSEDPLCFGLGAAQAREKEIGILPVGAPEIIVDQAGNEYVSSNHNLRGGTMLCRLQWVRE